MWQAQGSLIPYHENRSWAAADSIMRHLSDPVHSLRDTLQASGSLPGSMLHRQAPAPSHAISVTARQRAGPLLWPVPL